jgi:hypothetical protein
MSKYCTTKSILVLPLFPSYEQKYLFGREEIQMRTSRNISNYTSRNISNYASRNISNYTSRNISNYASRNII